MALTFVYGNAGSGKSGYMYQKFADMALLAPYQHYFVVVPEQFTMSAQRSLVDHSASGVITNIDVVSFERLAYRVFDELGVHRSVMEETGKSLILRRIVDQNEDDLTILRHNLNKMGYIGELKSILSELMQYGISPEDLEELLSELPAESELSFKLRDILSVYQSFDERLQEGYVTSERVLDLLLDVAGESGLLRGAILFFDGFTGFTPVQMNLMRKLMHLVSDIYVAVTLDLREPLYAPARMEDLFYMSHKMINALAAAARDASFEIAEPIRIENGENSRFYGNPVLSHLEQNLFRTGGHVQEESPYGRIRICSLINPRQELRFAASEIRSLVRQKGYRYRDCAVVCSDLTNYEKYADEVFAKFDIPLFLDRKQSLYYHPLIELIRAVLEIADTDYSVSSVFRYLRTGLCGFTSDEVDRLENYCIEKGIRGQKKWREEFTILPRQTGRQRIAAERLLSDLEIVNGLRERFYTQTKDVIAALRNEDNDVRAVTEALYDLIYGLSAEEKLREDTDRFEEMGKELLAAQNRQIYKIVIDLFDKMADLLGDEILPASDYAQILEAGFSEAKVGTIPPGSDCVILGDIERTRLEQIKVLFFLGVNDGSIPKSANRQSILSAYDREVMEEHRMELAPGEREQMFLQRFYLYLALTKPSDALYLTFARMNGSGAALRPSYLIGVLTRLFANLSVEEIETDEIRTPETAKSSVESYLKGLARSDKKEADPEWKCLHQWYEKSEEWSGRIRDLFDAHFSFYKNKNLDPAVAGMLYGTVLYNSVTRLERFEECAFAHYLEYGLKLAERSEFTFDSADMGSVLHRAAQEYGTRLDQKYSWTDVTEEQQDEILRESIETALFDLSNDSLSASAAESYNVERIYRILSRSVWAITEQIRRGDLIPGEYETEFPAVNPEESGAQVRAVGRVDRLDICVDKDRVLVRVIDYKSGKKELKLCNVLNGRQLQLPVYLKTVAEMLRQRYPDREIVPAGIFYFHFNDPMINETGDPEKNQKYLLETFKPDGLLNRDPSVYLRMDRELADSAQGKASEVIPASVNKGGALRASVKNALSDEDFTDLGHYVRMIMDDAAALMLEGEIAVRPYRMKENTGCDFCPYRAVCGFEEKFPGYRYREEEEIPDDKAMELIREKLEKPEPHEGEGAERSELENE